MAETNSNSFRPNFSTVADVKRVETTCMTPTRTADTYVDIALPDASKICPMKPRTAFIPENCCKTTNPRLITKPLLRLGILKRSPTPLFSALSFSNSRPICDSSFSIWPLVLFLNRLSASFASFSRRADIKKTGESGMYKVKNIKNSIRGTAQEKEKSFRDKSEPTTNG